MSSPALGGRNCGGDDILLCYPCWLGYPETKNTELEGNKPRCIEKDK